MLGIICLLCEASIRSWHVLKTCICKTNKEKTESRPHEEIKKTAASVNTLKNLIKLPVPPPHTELLYFLKPLHHPRHGMKERFFARNNLYTLEKNFFFPHLDIKSWK
jgi:hypothetical protein